MAALFKLIPVPKTPFLEIILPKKWTRRKGLAGVEAIPSDASANAAGGTTSESVDAVPPPVDPTAGVPGTAQHQHSSNTVNSTVVLHHCPRPA